MIFYLTFNDSPSGIYSSQVIDVVKFLAIEFKSNVRLVAFISIRGFLKNRSKIKQETRTAIVLPMFPGVSRWKYNILALKVLTFIYHPSAIIGRSVLATLLALKVKKIATKVVYDGRGAITAEWKEYKVVTDKSMVAQISGQEGKAINESDFRIAVSHQLIAHWNDRFGYRSTKHVVIPCTLNKIYENIIISSESIAKSRQNLGLNEADIVFVYSGSIAGWQSFDLLLDFIKPVLLEAKSNKLVFLSVLDKNIATLINLFPEQVFCKKVSPNEVPDYLLAGDFGLLIREFSTTNQVASPVKFAEYLACGLKPIISENLGDYSSFVTEHSIGSLYKEFKTAEKPSLESKIKINELAKRYFSKSNLLGEYEKLMKEIV